ncbi:MAG TPA: hypothetical protein VMV46_14780, partial [Thermoanaerobaculia bacterium]|nr:hypothetical protein [Thermoanaerobaculia bacterium]
PRLAPRAAPSPRSADAADGSTDAAARRPSELPDDLFYAQILLEREAERDGAGPTAKSVVEECLALLRGGDLETLRRIQATLFAQVVHPSDDLRRAAEMIGRHFS